MGMSDLRKLSMENEIHLLPITKKYADESDEKKFQFTFYCDHCGVGYQIPAIPFSGLDTVDCFDTFTNAQRLIWHSEHEDAYERANQRAMYCFKCCSGCKKMICPDCLDEVDDVPVCPDCRRTYEGK